MKEEEWPNEESFKKSIEKIWVKNFGDRRQEIVFIGLKSQMDENIIKKKLDGYLIKNYSINFKNSLKFKDPFPEWFKNNK